MDWEPNNSNDGCGMTVEDWRVARGDPDALSDWRIEHKCRALADLATRETWWPWTYAIVNRDFPCDSCNQSVPESIQAVFWFLKEG
jgi:hypothetical protein